MDKERHPHLSISKSTPHPGQGLLMLQHKRAGKSKREIAEGDKSLIETWISQTR